jgi:hypothetical protein
MVYLLQREVEYTANQKFCARLVHRCTHTHTHTHTHTYTNTHRGLSFWWPRDARDQYLKTRGFFTETNRNSIGCFVSCRLDSSWPAPIFAERWLRLGISGFGSTSWLNLQGIPFNLFRIFSTQCMAPYILKRTHYFGLEVHDSFAEVSCCTNLG